MISKKIKILFTILTSIAAIIVLSGYLHYKSLNDAEDPRIVEARKNMVEYNKLMSENEIGLALLVLDKVENIYKQEPGYKDSYELGVISNNRGSAFLIKVEEDLIAEEELDTESLAQAKQYIKKSVDIYANWLTKVSTLNEDQIYKMVSPYFLEDDPAFKDLDLEKIIEKRVEDILASKIETERRLSVSYTNLGIVYRYEGDFVKSKEQYERAVELWPENYAAKDNLNRLLGLPVEKRSLLKQIFFKAR